VPWLPEGLTACRFGAGFGATFGGGEAEITWSRASRMLGDIVLYWRDEDGPPHLEAIELNGRPAAWLASPDSSSTLVVLPADSGELWLVSGRLPREQVLRVAGSLPASA
jgi:hypothetical protein